MQIILSVLRVGHAALDPSIRPPQAGPATGPRPATRPGRGRAARYLGLLLLGTLSACARPAPAPAPIPEATPAPLSSGDVVVLASFDRGPGQEPTLIGTHIFVGPAAPMAGMILLPGCSGALTPGGGFEPLIQANAERWSHHGLTVLLVDSLTARSRSPACPEDGIDSATRTADALGAAAWLDRRADLRGRKTIFAGWGLGGDAALAAAIAARGSAGGFADGFALAVEPTCRDLPPPGPIRVALAGTVAARARCEAWLAALHGAGGTVLEVDITNRDDPAARRQLDDWLRDLSAAR